ncbi:MAG TPA: response regulator [Kofleriaceae bacterium]|nr:response regulator [Kofleriaceae bacterium]
MTHDLHAPPTASLTTWRETDPVTPRQRRVMTLLEERARRTELVEALACAGGLAPERTASVLCAELGELEVSAAEVGLEALGAMAHAMCRVIERVGHTSAPAEQREVIVLDDNEITRDLITLALQAEGHHVRSAACVAELAFLVRERRPHVLVSEARMPDAPGARFCNYLRQLAMQDCIPIVVFSSARGPELAVLAREAGASLHLSKDQGIGELMAGIERLLERPEP